MEALRQMDKIKAGDKTTFNLNQFREKCYGALNDDMNSPILIAHLFEGVKAINSALAGKESFTLEDLEKFRQLMHLFAEEIMGLSQETTADAGDSQVLNGVMELLLNVRQQAKKAKDFDTSDRIRDGLKNLGIEVRDGKDGADWEVK